MVANVGDILATTVENYTRDGAMADNISTNIPLLRNVMQRKNKTTAGGTKIRQTLIYAKNGTGKWYSGLEILDVSGSDVIDAADFDWKQYNVNVVVDGLEEIKNNGQPMMEDLVKGKIKAAEITAMEDVALALFSDGTGSSGKEIGGLQLLVADSPTSGTVGSIDRSSSANAFWRNQTYDFSTEAGGNASNTNIQSGMNALWLRTIRGTDKPDTIVADANFYTHYEESQQAIQRVTNAQEADAGFSTLMYKTAKVYFDDNCPSNHMYFLNTNYIFFRTAPGRNFQRKKEKMPTNQDAYVIPLYWAGALTMANASLQGVLKN